MLCCHADVLHISLLVTDGKQSVMHLNVVDKWNSLSKSSHLKNISEAACLHSGYLKRSLLSRRKLLATVSVHEQHATPFCADVQQKSREVTGGSWPPALSPPCFLRAVVHSSLFFLSGITSLASCALGWILTLQQKRCNFHFVLIDALQIERYFTE